MTKDKARKRAVRARMAKTGERYTAARLHAATTGDRDDWVTHDLGPGDEKLKDATGCDWTMWIYVLDRWGARERTHTEIARHVAETYDITGWWAQTVTVGYERARGMRQVNQRPDGFVVSVSKTVATDVATARAYLADGRRRGRWLPAGTVTPRNNRSERTVLFDGERGSKIQATLAPKGASKTTVTIQHARLGRSADVEPTRAFWKERLAALATTIEG